MCIYGAYYEGIKQEVAKYCYFLKRKIWTVCEITHHPPGEGSQVLLTIFLSLPGFLSAGRKQIAYQLSSVIYYLTHNWLLFLHWAMKNLEPPDVLCVCVCVCVCVCGVHVTTGTIITGGKRKLSGPKCRWENNIKILRLLSSGMRQVW